MADDGSTANPALYWTTPQATHQVIPPGNLSTGAPVGTGADDNFHEQSRAGSVKAGGGFTADANQSPAIDRGCPGDSFASEPAPAGG